MKAEYQVQEGYYTFDQAKRKFAFLTKSEAQKMLREAKYHFDKETREGVFTYPDGREIRLPANGWKGSDGWLYDVGVAGFYWLRDEQQESVDDMHVWYLTFLGSNIYLRTVLLDRSDGFSVYGQ